MSSIWRNVCGIFLIFPILIKLWHFYRSGKSACMKNPPPVKHSLPKNSPSKYIIPLQLPGKYLNLKEQCNGNKPCYVSK